MDSVRGQNSRCWDQNSSWTRSKSQRQQCDASAIVQKYQSIRWDFYISASLHSRALVQRNNNACLQGNSVFFSALPALFAHCPNNDIGEVNLQYFWSKCVSHQHVSNIRWLGATFLYRYSLSSYTVKVHEWQESSSSLCVKVKAGCS